ncbi:MAG TPA: hypothetical protein VH352_09335, partial [Pseudonocardiaceae bacterium]|nr:hypothetical protein [Pseudonocardiaceae bacterium]
MNDADEHGLPRRVRARLAAVPSGRLSAGLLGAAVVALGWALVRAHVLPSWSSTVGWLGRWWPALVSAVLVVAAVSVWRRGRAVLPVTGEPATRAAKERWSQLATVITAFTALAALAFTALSLRATRDQIGVAEQGQITDRYSHAIDQLGTAGPDRLQVRLGGIYALERLAAD